jgi:hypothetical protein
VERFPSTPSPKSDSSHWVYALVLMGLLVGAYVTLLRPARVWVGREVMTPIAQKVVASECRASAVPLGVAVHCQARQFSRSMRVPGGVLFVVPAMLLIFFFPGRPYWLWLGGYVVLLGAVSYLAFCIGAGGATAGFTVAGFLQGDIRLATCLGSPVIALWLTRRSGGRR